MDRSAAPLRYGATVDATHGAPTRRSIITATVFAGSIPTEIVHASVGASMAGQAASHGRT